MFSCMPGAILVVMSSVANTTIKSFEAQRPLRVMVRADCLEPTIPYMPHRRSLQALILACPLAQSQHKFLYFHVSKPDRELCLRCWTSAALSLLSEDRETCRKLDLNLTSSAQPVCVFPFYTHQARRPARNSLARRQLPQAVGEQCRHLANQDPMSQENYRATVRNSLWPGLVGASAVPAEMPCGKNLTSRSVRFYK